MDVSIEDFDKIMDLNVRAAYFVAQAVARRLMEAKRPGSIINISSQMGHVGAARRTVYCASKHAMEGFTKAMAIELAPLNIRVNSLGPTFIETPMTRPFFENKAFRDEVLGKIKLGRLGQLDELTGAIVFLASDASSLMTGSALGARRRLDRGIAGRSINARHRGRRRAREPGIEISTSKFASGFRVRADARPRMTACHNSILDCGYPRPPEPALSSTRLAHRGRRRSRRSKTEQGAAPDNVAAFGAPGGAGLLARARAPWDPHPLYRLGPGSSACEGGRSQGRLEGASQAP